MYPEKPKNKAKRGAVSRTRAALLIIILLIIIGSGSLSYFLLKQPTTIELNSVVAVRIFDGWAGLSPISPHSRTYDLTMNYGVLEGQATFTVGTEPLTSQVAVTIPAEVVAAFLEKLEEARLNRGRYTPLFDHTDDYPNVVIHIDREYDSIEIYSQSQGDEHIPWGATVDGNDYTINSVIPAEALVLLEPYLHGDVLQELINEAMSTPR
jgi:hypothetical protein